MITVALWSFAVFLASVFAAVLAGITLEPKYPGKIRAAVWTAAALLAYAIAFLSYYINLYNDLVGILGLSAMVCMVAQLLYKGTWSTKLVVALMGCLIGNVSTFMLCGTTDTLAGSALGLIRESPYDTPNLLFFIGIKLVVYTVGAICYAKLLRKYIHNTIESVEGKMAVFVPALLVSVAGFYVINLFSNSNGIYPDNKWFFPLYLTVCVMFLVEFWMIFYSINQSAVAMKNAAELNVAANIQQSMLPCIFPAFPARDEFSIYATMNPAKEVGGDFYDFFMVDEGHLAMVIADVSGKGVPAALFMVIGKTLIKDHTQPGRDLGKVFTEVNNLLCESNSEGLFITAFEGVLDLATGQFDFVNAGHEMPFISRAGGDFEAHRIRPGFVLAGMEDMRYQAGSFTLEAGDKIFQYTDGVTEATNARNELYGMERLGEILRKNRSQGPAGILTAVKKDIDRFVGSAPQFDDITMICMEYKGGGKR
ncbi:MAG: PP2C family protein-serine/threonine phosphatase [Acetatifactor sp.]|nr:PP2C family protein-serine/threonine phosphatase [Acetatifactor sp.]